MKRRTIAALLAALAFLGALPARAFETQEALREAYAQTQTFDGDTPYAQEPVVRVPYSAGTLEESALDDALSYLNFLRAVANLAPVERSMLYDFQCQHGAALLAALDYADHDAPRPDDMNADFYASAHSATSSSNLAKFNWMRATILREGLEYFVRDDGEGNLGALGHRRWLLNPNMGATGFGLANSESGMSYVLMYAHDFGASAEAWSEVCWPAEGAFPVELMHADLAWSVSLNPEIYDAENSRVRVTLADQSGLRFCFSEDTSDGFFAVSTEAYGAGPCVIFRPDFSDTDFTDYEQNQVWTVRIDGLRTVNGEERVLEYIVSMTSLSVQEVANVEIDPLKAELQPGETLQVTANVIPAYADDLSVQFETTAAAVAVVDANGIVTAVAPGECEIIARSANGRADRCRVTVAP